VAVLCVTWVTCCFFFKMTFISMEGSLVSCDFFLPSLTFIISSTIFGSSFWDKSYENNWSRLWIRGNLVFIFTVYGLCIGLIRSCLNFYWICFFAAPCVVLCIGGAYTRNIWSIASDFLSGLCTTGEKYLYLLLLEIWLWIQLCTSEYWLYPEWLRFISCALLNFW